MGAGATCLADSNFPVALRTCLICAAPAGGVLAGAYTGVTDITFATCASTTVATSATDLATTGGCSAYTRCVVICASPSILTSPPPGRSSSSSPMNLWRARATPSIVCYRKSRCYLSSSTQETFFPPAKSDAISP